VVVVGGAHDMDAVSSVVLSLVVLVRPLSWCGLILPLTPSKLHPYIEAPIPLIVGVTAVPEGVDLSDSVVVDLTKGTVGAPGAPVCMFGWGVGEQRTTAEAGTGERRDGRGRERGEW
jgi:hypothetical protein